MNPTSLHLRVEIAAYMLTDGFIQNLLQGIVLTQFCNYWAAYADDRWWMKVYVGIIVLLSV